VPARVFETYPPTQRQTVGELLQIAVFPTPVAATEWLLAG